MTQQVIVPNTVPTHLLRALLPWESDEAFIGLVDGLFREHQPRGATETALVERLAMLIWRRQRLALAERALHLSAAARQVGGSDGRLAARAALITETQAKPDADAADALTSDEAGDVEDRAYLDEERKDLDKAIALLEAGQSRAVYDQALACLRGDTIEWWTSRLEDAGLDVEGVDSASLCDRLLTFLNVNVAPEVRKLRNGVEQRANTRLQLWGQSLDPIRAARLMALDSELDRQFERTLGMLLKLMKRKLA